MKVDFLAKAKWYIVGFILVAIMLSVSLSFSAWDTLSFKAAMNAKGGDFKETPPWGDYIKDKDGNDLPNIPTVGDIVTYGKFYQTANTNTPTALKWIVVHNDGENKLTLLSEQIISRGSYWYGKDNATLNDYYRSTVRSWLNSGKGSLIGSGTDWDNSEKGRYKDNVRNDDIGSKFGEDKTVDHQVNKGFLDVAFTGGAEKLLVPKQITGMKHYRHNTLACQTNGNSPDKSIINDLVWIPSQYEIFGTSRGSWQIDGTSDTRFSYFGDNPTMANKNSPLATSTGYAKGSNSNYYNNGVSDDSIADGYWLRSPYPAYINSSFNACVVASGTDYYHTASMYGGVRPAVDVQL